MHGKTLERCLAQINAQQMLEVQAHTHTLHVHVFVDTEFSPRDLGDQREEREKSSYKLKLSIIYCPEDLDTGKINK